MVFFVHGGAWGSGHPWMYRLMAVPFLKMNMAVAVVGYRTYPDGNAQDQVDDLEQAARSVYAKYGDYCVSGGDEEEKEGQDDDWLGVVLMGHSSGAHIGLLMMVQRVERHLNDIQSKIAATATATATATARATPTHSNASTTLQFDKFVGLSGVYNISHHFDYEAGRGVEEISPMKPACGYTRQAFDHFSPALKLKSLLSRSIPLPPSMSISMSMSETNHNGGIHEEYPNIHTDTNTNTTDANSNTKNVNVHEIITNLIPDTLLVHGVHDTTVPFTSTAEAGSILRSCGVRRCDERYVVTGHADVAVEVMMEGTAGRAVMDWLASTAKSKFKAESEKEQKSSVSVEIQSRL